MDDASQELRRDLESFQLALKKLGIGISKASLLWKDNKYRDLTTSLGAIAEMSKLVLKSGDKSCSSLNRFSKIAKEEY